MGNQEEKLYLCLQQRQHMLSFHHVVRNFYGSSNNLRILGLTNIIPLICYNTNAINMTKNPMQQKITKHIDVIYKFLRDNVEQLNVEMKFCKTEYQLANIFTKPLSKECFVKNRLRLGMLKITKSWKSFHKKPFTDYV